MSRELPLHVGLQGIRGVTHEVQVLCSCDDIEQCRMEVYVSDVRLLIAELEQARATLDLEGTAECPR